MIETTFYNNMTDAVVTAENNNQEDDKLIISFPWDNDSFSLCLDTFPSSRLARTTYNKYPATASPLRKHWRCSSNIDSNNDDHLGQEFSEKEEEVGSIVTSSSASIASSSSVIMPQQLSVNNIQVVAESRTKRRAKKKIMLNNNNNSSASTFPYNNDGNFFLDPTVDQVKKSSSLSINTSAAVLKKPQQQKGRVEHISPFSSSILLFPQPEEMVFRSYSNSRNMSSASSMKSVVSTENMILSIHNNNNDSQVSNAGTIESWKVAQNPVMATTAIALPPVGAGGIIRPQQYNPTPSHEYYGFQYPPSRSGSSISDTMAPFSYSGSVHSHSYFAPPSPNGSYSSMPVTTVGNDDIGYYSSSPSSIYSTQSGFTDRHRHSQYFNPSYKSSSAKISSSSAKKKSIGLFTKLMKNIKHHFNKNN